MKRFPLKIFLAILIILILSFSHVDARVGGGQSYGGGSSSSGGGYNGGGDGGGGSGELIFLLIRLLIWLIVEVPAIGIPLTIIIIAAVIVHYTRQAKVGSHRSTSYVNTYNSPYQIKTPRRSLFVCEQIRRYKKVDLNFSKPLFLDFVQILYTRVQIARGDKSWAGLLPYLSQSIAERFKKDPSKPDKIESVVIGSSNIKQIDSSESDFDKITVEFEANYTEYRQGGIQAGSVIYYVREKWFFQRKKGVLSKGPEDISSLHCPSCGSPVELRPDGTCPHCDMVVNKGDFHWQIFNIMQIEKYPRPPLKLGGGGVETGTDLPNVYQSDFDAQKRSFMMRYPNFSPGEFAQKVRNTFMKLQNAWSSCDWEMARSLETDHLFSTHKYWIERYRAESLRNCLEDIEILAITTVKIEQDAYYEGITVRIKARLKDYTANSSGKVVEGSKTGKRTFSEYWTFIRRAGFAEDRKEKKEDSCPNCGAGIKLSMAGICDYCGSKITSGEFDWILSSIEQDEAYEG